MPLSPGARLGPYEVVSALGAGGMGEVYRARDTKLGRDVALKVLPDGLASDPDRLARFQREAKTLASLNHPNIGSIYGLEETHGVTCLVMELVEGEDLSQRIARGAIPFDEVLPIAKQMAEALEAAHEQGIIHRDLKPANIKVRPDGAVKVLDFGLAKAMDSAGRVPNVSQSPTITTPAMTEAGIILGTAAYMSPEQARGTAVDKRADLWAFGVVLWEMLTAQRLFDGATVSDTLASVLTHQPDWQALPVTTPSAIRRLLRRCLEKDRKRRLADAADARLEIEEAVTAPSGTDAEATPPVAIVRRRIVAMASVMLLVGAAVAATTAWMLTRPAPAPPQQPVRFAIVPPANELFGRTTDTRDLALSANGTHLAYVGGGRLMVRATDQLEAVALEGISGARSPFFSPDGRWIGFFAQTTGELKRVPLSGGASSPVGRYVGAPRGASWAPDDTIVFATNDPSSGLFRVSADGGEPTVLTTPDAAHGEADHLFPKVLPGGQAVLFTITGAGPLENAQVAVLDLATGQHRTLVRGGSQAEYIETGHLVYAVAGTLRAARFDLARRQVVGDFSPVQDQVMVGNLGQAHFALSRQGTLVYLPALSRPQTPPRSLLWVTRQGREELLGAPQRPYAGARLSPDSTRVALDIRDPNGDIWIWNVNGRTFTPLTHSEGSNNFPLWTADGQRVIWSSSRGSDVGNLYWQAADGTGAASRLTTSPSAQFATSISTDSTSVVLFSSYGGSQWRVVSLIDMKGASTERVTEPLPTKPLLQSVGDHQNGEISPDGRWIAYQSNESGQFQVYVRPFPNVDAGRWPISPGGGTRPAWARSGRELFYLDGDDLLTSVTIHTTATTVSAGPPTRILDTRYLAGLTPRGLDIRAYDVSPDGQRFLMIKEDAAANQTLQPGMVVVVHWAEELKAKVLASK